MPTARSARKPSGRGRAKPRRRKEPAKRSGDRWSGAVTRGSDALDLERGVFTWRNPRRIARSLKASAEHSRRRKAGAYRSAMSMLTFYINRGGRNLSAPRRKILNRAKAELRRLYGRESA
jgi:hypothetical protein